MAEPTNTKKRVVLPGHHEGSLDMHQRRQGELPKGSDAQAASANRLATTMPEGTQAMDLSKVDNNNRETIRPMKIGKDTEDTYKNVDFGKGHNNFALTENAAKKAGAGK